MQFMSNYHTCTTECEPLGKGKVPLSARVIGLQPFAHGSTPDPPPCLTLAQTQSPTDRLYVLRPQLQQVGDLPFYTFGTAIRVGELCCVCVYVCVRV